jgi:hypothetical protein
MSRAISGEVVGLVDEPNGVGNAAGVVSIAYVGCSIEMTRWALSLGTGCSPASAD